MKKIRMMATSAFTRNIAGSIVHGDPEHPDNDGKFPLVSEEQARLLLDAGLVKKMTARQRASLDENDLTAEDDDDDDDDAGDGVVDVEAASTAGTGASQSAQEVRDQRTDTTTTGTGKDVAKRRTARGGKTPTAGEKGGAPAGGNDTNASTNHPTTAVSGDGTTSATNEGATSDPDPDAPPTE